MNKKILTTLLFALLCTVAWSQRRLDLSGYTMVWNDEFDYTGTQAQIRDQMFNSNIYPQCKWRNGYSWGDNVPGDYAIAHIDQISVSNGVLYMKTEKKATVSQTRVIDGDTLVSQNRGSQIMARYNHDYFSKMSWGSNPWDTTSSFHYGIFEIRAKLPASDFSEAAFWFWGHPDQGSNIFTGDFWCGNPPPNGTPCPPGSHPTYCASGWELDVFEFLGKTSASSDDDFFSTNQPNPLITNPMPCASCATWYDWLNSKPTQTFHTYALSWTPTRITWFIDGNEVRTQSDGIPPAKMDLLIGNFINYTSLNYVGPTQGLPLEVDYVRVYRPTPTTGFNYIIDYVNTGNINQTSSIWSNGYKSNVAGVDPEIVAYRNAYNNTSSEYLKNENYRLFYSQNQLGSGIGNRVLDQSTTGNRIYYTEGNSLKRVFIPPAYDGVSPLTPENLNVNNVLLNSPLITWQNNIYYLDNSSKIWVYRKTGTTATNYQLDATINVATVIDKKIVFAPANSLHPDRIYFTTLGGCSPFPCFTRNLAYYEWCAADSKWYVHLTNAVLSTAVGGMVSGSPNGKLHFVMGNEIYNLWSYTTTGSACNNVFAGNCQYSSCGNFGDVAAESDLAKSPDGSKYFYRTTNNGLAYRYWNGTAWERELIKEVTDVGPGNIKVKNSQDGQRLEIFYVSIDDKLKTCYQRKAPLVNGKQVWQNSTLDVFSLTWQDANGTYQRATAYDVQGRFDINTGYPTQVFVLKTDEKLGVYRSGTNWTTLLHPYTTCHSWDEPGKWYNGVEFRQVNPEAAAAAAEEEESNAINIYPNPSDGQITVDIGDAIGASDIEIYTLDGKLLQKESITSNITTLDLRLENSGTYILRLTNNNQVYNQLFQIIK